MYVEFDSSYWSKYREDTSNPSMNHLTYCKGMIDALKSLNIWSSVEEDLPMKSQVYDVSGCLCNREFVCGLTEEEWDYVGNLLVTLPNYPTPLFFFCAYPIHVPAPKDDSSTLPSTTRKYITQYPLVFVSFGLDNFESYATSKQNFTISDADIIFDYDVTASTTYNIGDLVRFDGNVYRCLVDGCNCKPWENNDFWLPQLQQLINLEKYGKKVYTAGILTPKYLATKSSGEKLNTFFYNKTKIVTNWYASDTDVVHPWRVEDVPYAKGTIVEYNGRRYKNISDNVGGCICAPVPYNFILPHGCSGHWLPEFFEDFPFEVQSPILPVFTANGREHSGGSLIEDVIVSYLHDTLTFVDCTNAGINERGWKEAHIVPINHVGVGDAWVAISPGGNNLQTEVLCDYYVFGGRWPLGDSRFHFTITREDKYYEVSSRPNYSGSDCPKSTVLFNEISPSMGLHEVSLNSSMPTTFSDLYGCGLINASVDSIDGVNQTKALADYGIVLHSDFPMRMTITTRLKLIKLSRTDPNFKKNDYSPYNTSVHSSTETNHYSYYDNDGLVTYEPLLNLGNSKSKQQLTHNHTMFKSQLNGINYLSPIWMYVKREPVALDSWSTVFRSRVLFACDSTYSGYKEFIHVDNKTYIVFKYALSTYSNNDGRYGLAILVDEGEN